MKDDVVEFARARGDRFLQVAVEFKRVRVAGTEQRGQAQQCGPRRRRDGRRCSPAAGQGDHCLRFL